MQFYSTPRLSLLVFTDPELTGVFRNDASALYELKVFLQMNIWLGSEEFFPYPLSVKIPFYWFSFFLTAVNFFRSSCYSFRRLAVLFFNTLFPTVIFYEVLPLFSLFKIVFVAIFLFLFVYLFKRFHISRLSLFNLQKPNRGCFRAHLLRYFICFIVER